MTELTKHEATHSNKKPYTCRVCDKKFPDSDTYYKHKTTHDKSYKCKSCGKKFGDRHNLKKHEENHHSSSKPRCSNCRYEF